MSRLKYHFLHHIFSTPSLSVRSLKNRRPMKIHRWWCHVGTSSPRNRWNDSAKVVDSNALIALTKVIARMLAKFSCDTHIHLSLTIPLSSHILSLSFLLFTYLSGDSRSFGLGDCGAWIWRWQDQFWSGILYLWRLFPMIYPIPMEFDSTFSSLLSYLLRTINILNQNQANDKSVKSD